jgi:hypothetical protein
MIKFTPQQIEILRGHFGDIAGPLTPEWAAKISAILSPLKPHVLQQLAGENIRHLSDAAVALITQNRPDDAESFAHEENHDPRIA